MTLNFVGAMNPFGAKPKAAIRAPVAHTGIELSGGDDPFATRVHSLLAGEGEKAPSIMGGTLELVGLDDVRRALGRTWPTLAAQVGELAERVLKANLRTEDFYRPHGSSSFLICFVGLGEADARRRARSIADSIKWEIVRSFPSIAPEIAPEQFVAPLDRKLLQGDGGSFVDKLVQHLLTLRKDAERTISRFRLPLLRRSKLTFTPAWHATRSVTAFNRSMLDSWTQSDLKENYRAHMEDFEYQRVIAEFDYVTLTRSLRAFYKMLKVGKVVPLLVPVSYRTLSHPDSGANYRRLLETMRPAHRSLLAIEVNDVWQDIDPATVLKTIDPIAPAVRWLAVEVDLVDPRLPALASAKLWALATDLRSRKSTDPTLGPQLRRFRALAAGGGLNTLVHGASSIGLALSAAEAGATYIDGPAIHAPGHEPRAPGPLKPMVTPFLSARRSPHHRM